MNMLKKIGLVACTILGSVTVAHAQSLSIGVGLSTPNEAVSSVYNNITLQNFGEDLKDAASFGYHIQAKYRFGLGESVRFALGAGWHRFPEADIIIKNPQDDKTYVLTATSNIIPITAGIEYSLIKSAIGVYLMGDLSYNYLANSVGLKQGDIDLPFAKSETLSRVGAGLGAGVDFDLNVLTLDVGAKYNLVNLINKENADEPDRSYFALTVSVVFGSR
jgi:hypothetical protein